MNESKRGTRGHFTSDELEYIRTNYKRTNLKEIAKALGREKNYQNVCRAARRMGLTDQKGEKVEHPTTRELARKAKYDDPEERKRAIGASTKARQTANGHPRGMQGKTHSDEFRQKQRVRLTERWKDPNSIFNQAEFRDSRSTSMSQLMVERIQNGDANQHTKGRGGTRDDLGFYVRSAWEANYARYLNWLLSKNEIYKWEYEVDTYWFEHIKRGVRSYTPDFKVWSNSEKYEYHEVKGYMDQKSKTKLKRMDKYYPNEKVIVIAAEEYKSIKKWSRLIPGWE